jgi:hypothetical protein
LLSPATLIFWGNNVTLIIDCVIMFAGNLMPSLHDVASHPEPAAGSLAFAESYRRSVNYLNGSVA